MTVPRSAAEAAATTDADVIVVGAGMAGLVLAHDLARAGRRVIVIEAAAEVGGLLRCGTLAGVDIDLGAESFATRTDAVADLVADAHLDLQLVPPRPQGAWLAIATDDGVMRARLPRRTVLGIPADPDAEDVVAIIGVDGAARARAEQQSPVDPEAEPSLYDLVAGRLGERVADRLVDTLCRSVYSRPAAEAQLSHVHPGMWREFVARGSLLAAADAIATAQRAGAAVGGIEGGMWRLPAALAGAATGYGADIRTGVDVHAVRRGAGTVAVDTSSGSLSAPHVVIATGPAECARLLSGEDTPEGCDVPTRSARPATEGETPPGVRLVAAAIAHSGLADEPVGSGVIVGATLPTAAKALTHITAKWDWARTATPDGIHLVRLSARDGASDTLRTPDEIAREVSVLTGLDIVPDQIVDVVAQHWPDAVAGRPVLDTLPVGIHLAGATAAGTGLASVIPHARELAARLDGLLTAPLTPVSSLHTHPVS